MAGSGMIQNPILSAGRIVAMLAAASAGLSLPDTKFKLYDDGDATKIAQFQCSGITSGQTRTYTLPDASTTLAGLGVAQTFTAAQTFTGNINQTGATTFSTGTGAVSLNGAVTCASTLASTSTTTGALVVSGGVGVAGDVYIGNTVRAASVYFSGAAGSGTGGNYRTYNDAGTLQWTFGILGSIGETAWSLYNNVTEAIPISVNATTAAIALNGAVTCSSGLTVSVGNLTVTSGINYTGNVSGDNNTDTLIITSGGATEANIEMYGTGSGLAGYIYYDADVHTFRRASGGTTYLTIDHSAGKVTVNQTTDGALTVNGKIAAKVAVPVNFDDSSLANLAADIQSYLASILT